MTRTTATKKTAADPVPELESAMRDVERTFKEWRAAQTKLTRSKRTDSMLAASKAAKVAELAYRKASDRRDELVQIRNARLTQRGDARGAQWSKPDGVDAPAIILGPGVKTARPVAIIIKRGGYDPTLAHDHPNNFDPTLEEWPQCGFHFEHDPVTEAPKGAQCTNLATHRIIWEDEQRYSFGCNQHLEIEHDASVKPAKVERLPWTHPTSGNAFVRGPVSRRLLMKAAHKLAYLARDYPDDKETRGLIVKLQALLAVP